MTWQFLTLDILQAHRQACIDALNTGGFSYPPFLRVNGFDDAFFPVSLLDMPLTSQIFQALNDEQIEADPAQLPITAVAYDDAATNGANLVKIFDTDVSGDPPPLYPSDNVGVVIETSAGPGQDVEMSPNEVSSGDEIQLDSLTFTLQYEGTHTELDVSAQSVAQFLDDTGSANPAATIQIRDAANVVLWQVQMANPWFVDMLDGRMKIATPAEAFPVAAGTADHCRLLDRDMTPQLQCPCILIGDSTVGLHLSSLEFVPTQAVRVGSLAISR